MNVTFYRINGHKCQVAFLIGPGLLQSVCEGRYSVLDGSDLENPGVKPDIYVKNTFKDRLEGKDPQLDAAIAEVLKEMK